MNDPFRVGLLATSYEVERCVNTNTVILYSQVLMYYLLQNPTGQKITPIFFPDILEKKFDFA